MDLPDLWTHEVAALLSQIGRSTLPQHLVDADPQALTDPGDRALLLSHPQRAQELLANIPRLERPGRIIARQYDAAEPTSQPRLSNANPDGETAVAWGGCVLRVALKFAEVYDEAGSELAARQYVAGILGESCPTVIEALMSMATTECEDAVAQLHALHIDQLQVGMFTAAPVLLCNARPLLGRGRELTPALLARAAGPRRPRAPGRAFRHPRTRTTRARR